jgi:transposase
MSPRSISDFMRNFGGDSETLVAFMREFIGNDSHIIFDGTGIASQSSKMGINRVGYSAGGGFDPQINLLCAFSRDSKKPVYCRIVAGNVRDVTALSLTLKETGLHDTVVVADKGFGSDANFKLMDEAGIRYVVPLRRNNTLIDADRLKKSGKAGFEGYFMYAKRPIWYFQKGSLTVFLDDALRVEEERTYLNIENDVEGYTMESFLEKSHKFGIIALYSNTGRKPDEIYHLYKERGEIEQTFDFLKNLLEQDKSYMQNPRSLETWAFINHISLLMNYKIYNLLREKKLLSRYSVADILFQFKYIHKIMIGGEWITSESTKKTRALLKSLGLHIT